MSQFSTGTRSPSPSPSPSPKEQSGFRTKHVPETFSTAQRHLDSARRPVTPPSHPDYGTPVNGSPRNSNSNSPSQRPRSTSRPMSMVQTYQPPLMDINEDTIPELQPIFTFLNSHSNKLYGEGYFLKLDDQNSQGKPNPDRTWTECFAQLVGTVLSLWDAAELDAAGEDGEVLPKFINLTDASIKMIDSLPTRSTNEQPLQNILSISTAGRNRYLLHFNSHASLILWTAGIRLAMYEHSTLQEAYTGALVAGKGKTLNNINVIMERSRFKTEEWVRVRFGAGVPWRRCWCVITPPDEKEIAKLHKEMKKRSPYDRSSVPALKGDIKFYDTRKDGKKQKKAQPIATITDAYSAYAIYPQAKSLVDASTLLKIEGHVTVHSNPPSSTEGFIFIMPETHPAVSGFEMLLRFLFPTWDTFGLYGRPGRLVASVLDPRSLMFALPKHKRYGYLEPLDVSTLILDDGSSAWTEREWRKRLKDATGTRMNAIEDGPRSHSRSASRSSTRLSGGGGNGAKPKVGFTDNQASVRSSRSFSLNGGARTDAALPDRRMHPGMPAGQPHPLRNTSDPDLGRSDFAPNVYGAPRDRQPSGEPGSSDEELGNSPPPEMRDLEGMRNMQTPEPVSRPPAFNHGPQARPISKAYHSPELRRANSRLSSTTLDQMAKAGAMSNASDMPPTRHAEDGVLADPSVYQHADSRGTSANQYGSREALSPASHDRPPARLPPPLHGHPNQRSRSPMAYPPHGHPNNTMNDVNYAPRPHTADGRRPPQTPGPSRSPNPQHPNFRPDQHRPPHGGPAGPPSPHGRGRPPNQRPPPGHGPPYHEQHSNYGPGPGPRPYPGPHPGSQGRGAPPPNFHHRKPLPPKTHQSLTPNDIIEHYVSDAHRGGPPQGKRQPPPPNQQGPRYGGTDNHHNGNHPGPSDHAHDGRGSFDQPRAGPPRPMGSLGEAPAQRNPEFDVPEYMQQRTPPATSPQYSYGGNLAAGPPGSMGPRTPSPQPLHYTAGRSDGPLLLQQGGSNSPNGGMANSFSRPLRNGAHSPSDARHGPGPGPGPGTGQKAQNLPHQYQGQAF
ncbi:PH domain protein [Ophiocordyceps sinensis CO18]|uniref:PH domain protein n=1 Tax=Ophiocordyceps sinensis (strain Co18 / CGMCC 3.14243) TaxID=911162 RepID=T5APF1_OPHSC|nr:PH domain protein [Ophiocordyceps sinensis CO18]